MSNPSLQLAGLWRQYPDPERWNDGGPGHAHQIGPLCAVWDKPDWGDVDQCDHGSCLMQVHEPCEACFAEAMDEATGKTELLIRCGTHGDQRVTDSGHNSGFAGEGLCWLVLACGCPQMEEGIYS